jgi:N-acetylmuramoyl-L-alanine amidase
MLRNACGALRDWSKFRLLHPRHVLRPPCREHEIGPGTLKKTSSHSALVWGALLAVVALPGVQAHARARYRHSESWARERYAIADRLREALNGRPQNERTRRDYQRVLNSYRAVYLGAPASSKADPSAVAVAETLVEMGRRFDDDKILNEAIAQYRFVRREYPGSRDRCNALFTIGEIYKDDLNDPEKARAVFQDFLAKYPKNQLADDAQDAIADLNQQAEAARKAEAKRDSAKKASEKTVSKTAEGARASEGEDKKSSDVSTEAKFTAPVDSNSSHLARVTRIQHWSTPDYSRVAIDLESEIKFGSQRISKPDRIFFDLRDTKLASTLVGKTFDVDDGFLKKIRIAQFQPGRTRVVLEVDDLSAYEAFLLPNPYRLIIDIHGKNDSKSARRRSLKDDPTGMADLEAPPKAGTKTDSDSQPAADPASATAKDDLRATAGKAPVTTQDIGDDVKVVSASAAEAKRGKFDLPKQVDASREVPAPTKVVVEADDDDDTADSPTAATRAPSRARTKPPAKLAATTRKGSDFDVREARPTASGDRSLIRALGLKIGKIVIDPGHGGHDTGTIGPNGLQEKDLVLEVGRRLGKMLETRLGAEVVYTRKNDTFIPLETRTAIANQQRADLFVSVHANSSRDPDARGVETYYLNFTSSPEALEVAARENAVSEKSIYELQDLVKKIALKEKIEESREFAGDVQQSLHSGLSAKNPGIRNRGVKKAPFIVLIGANMPSILAEISFVSNPGDEHRLETSDYRQRIAESLYRGIAKYVDGLSGVKMASKIDKAAGQ